MPSRHAAAKPHAPLLSGSGIAPSDGEVRAGLESLLNCKSFNASSRNRRFLTYVVEETLAGRGDRIKAYNIAISAFDRAEDFDPLSDPIVRIEASRLRRSLEHYYLTAGRDERVRIGMPKGSYVASFDYHDVAEAEVRERAAAADTPVETIGSEARLEPVPHPAGATGRIPWRTRAVVPIAAALVVVLLAAYVAYDAREYRYAIVPDDGRSVRIDPIQADPQSAKQFALARGLTYELVSQLTRHHEVRVYASDNTAVSPADSQRSEPDYVLTGFAQSDGSTARILVQLTDRRSGRIVWGSSFDTDMAAGEGFDFQVKASEEVVDAILRQVAPSYRIQPGSALSLETAAIRKLR